MKLGTDVIQTTESHSNIDSFYGPYYIGNSEDTKFSKYKRFDNIDELLEFLQNYSKIGLTVGIIEDSGKISEYWFLKNDDSDQLILSEKGFNLELKDFLIEVETPLFIKDNLYQVRVEYPSIGKVIGGKVSFIIDNGNPKETRNYTELGDFYIFTNVSIGTHSFKVVITDALGSSCSGVEELVVGQIKVSLKNNSLNSIRALKLINVTSLLGKPLKYSVEILDNNISKFGLYADSTSLLVWERSSGNSILSEYTYDFDSLVDGKTVYFRAFEGDEIAYEEKLFEVLGSSTLYGELLYPNSLYNFVIHKLRTIDLQFKSGASEMEISSVETNTDFTFTSTTLKFNPNTGTTLLTLEVDPLRTSTSPILEIKYSETESLFINLQGVISEQSSSNRTVEWDNLESYNEINYNSCFIDFTATLMPSLDGTKIVRFNDLMWIDNDVIHVNSIEIATPLGEKHYIGMGYGLEGTSKFSEIYNNANYYEYKYFDCICVDGVIVKVSPSGIGKPGDDTGKTRRDVLEYWETPILEIGENTQAHKMLYIQVDTSPIVLEDTFIREQIEGHYEEDFNIIRASVAEDLPVLELRAIPYNASDFNNYWDKYKLFKESIFGEITEGFTKIFTKLNFDSDKKLFKFSEELKKDKFTEDGKKHKPQEVYGVPCEYTYSDGINPPITNKVIVYTLGTSTLRYLIPNFKLFFQEPFTLTYQKEKRDDLDTIIKQGLSVTDNVYTIKADYMESAHLNNTPLAILYDKITGDKDGIKEIISKLEENYLKSPADFDAIVGTPVLVKIKDIGKEEIDLGIFMFNTDKTSSTLGLNKLDYDCISLEGNSNESKLTLSRFLVPKNESEEDINVWNNIDEDVMEHNGLEIRSTTFLEPEDAFLVFYDNYWSIINDKNNENYISNMERILSIPYCELYLIFMMVFGLSDNVGKNCMFDAWKKTTDTNWGKLFPRFYDLDSSNGLNNSGEETILPYAIVSKNWTPDNGSFEYDNFRILSYKYIKGVDKLYLYSSPDSLLWEYVFKNHLDEINNMYANLRDSYLSFDYLKEHFNSVVLNKVPYYQYNKDFRIKYLLTNNLLLMYGNRKTNFFDWLESRLAFCDSFFAYKQEKYHVGGLLNINPVYMFPAYIAYDLDSPTKYFQFGRNPLLSAGTAGGSATIAVYLADKIVTELTLYNNSGIQSLAELSGTFEFENLRTLTIAGNYCPSLSYCKNLSELNIKSFYIQNVPTIPANVRVVKREAEHDPTTNTDPTTVTLRFAANSLVEEIDLSYCNINNDGQGYNLSTLTHLKKIKLNHCTINGNFILPNTTGIIFETTNCVFSGGSIITNSHTGVDVLELNNLTIAGFLLKGSIGRIDLFNSQIPSTLDLHEVSGIRLLNLVKSNVQNVLVGGDTFASKITLGVLLSQLETFKFKTDENNSNVGVDLNVFKGKTVTSIINYVGDLANNSTTPIKTIALLKYDKTSGKYKGSENISSATLSTVMETAGLSFGWTNIEKVTGSDSTINGVALFAKCTSLTTVICSNLKASSNWIFYNCNKLTELQGVKIDKFVGAFYNSKLSYSKIEAAIDSASTDGNFTHFMACYLGGPSILINASNYPTLTGVRRMFCQSLPSTFFDGVTSGNISSVEITNSFIPSSTLTSLEEMFFNCKQVTLLNSNLLSNYDYIDSASGTFGLCTLLNISELRNMTYLTNALGMFASSTISDSVTNENKLTLTNSRLLNCVDMFNNTKFEGDNSIIVDDFIKNVSSLLIDLTNCFYNARNSSDKVLAYINSTLEINNSTNSVDITGFLASEGSANQESFDTAVVYNQKFTMKDTLFTGFRGANRNSTNENHFKYFGPFANRKTNNTSITLGSDSSQLNLSFYLCLLEAISGINVTVKNPLSLARTFYRAKTISGLSINTLHTELDFSAYQAFKGCTFSDGISIPEAIMTKVSSAEEMFATSNLKEINFLLTNTVTDVRKMFSSCRLLEGGIPSGFYTNLSENVTDFTRIFYGTRITTSSSGTSFSPFPDLATNISGALAAVKFDSSTALNTPVILGTQLNPMKCTNITGLLAISDVLISSIYFLNSVKADYAFVNRNDDGYTFSTTSCNAIHAYISGTVTAPAPIYDDSINTFSGIGAYYNWSGYIGNEYDVDNYYYSTDAYERKANDTLTYNAV